MHSIQRPFRDDLVEPDKEKTVILTEKDIKHIVSQLVGISKLIDTEMGSYANYELGVLVGGLCSKFPHINHE